MEYSLERSPNGYQVEVKVTKIETFTFGSLDEAVAKLKELEAQPQG